MLENRRIRRLLPCVPIKIKCVFAGIKIDCSLSAGQGHNFKKLLVPFLQSRLDFVSGRSKRFRFVCDVNLLKLVGIWPMLAYLLLKIQSTYINKIKLCFCFVELSKQYEGM